MCKLTKKQKDTEIYYNQSGDPMQIRTHDRKLIHKLTALSEEFPELCRLVEEDEYNGSYFEVNKHRVSIHVTRPYSKERRKKQSEWAKESGINRHSDVPEKSRAAYAANGTNATTEIKKEAQSGQD